MSAEACSHKEAQVAEANNFDIRPRSDESVEQVTLEERNGVFYTESRDGPEFTGRAGQVSED